MLLSQLIKNLQATQDSYGDTEINLSSTNWLVPRPLQSISVRICASVNGHHEYETVLVWDGTPLAPEYISTPTGKPHAWRYPDPGECNYSVYKICNICYAEWRKDSWVQGQRIPGREPEIGCIKRVKVVKDAAA